jgi:hypothetical protein
MDVKFTTNDFKDIKKQFLIGIRANKSQTWMSQRLGYTYNQYGKWESDIKKLTWADFNEICNLRKISLRKELIRIYNISLTSKNCFGGELLTILRNNFFSNNTEKFSKFLKVNAPTLRRWLDNKQDVPIEKVFLALSYRPQLFLLFIYSLQIIKIPKKFEQSLNLYLEVYSTESLFPYISGVHAFINTHEYQNLKQHSDEFIANKLGHSIAQVKKAIDLLAKNHAIKIVNNKYALNLSGVEQKGIPNSDLIRSLRYWNYKALCFLEKKAKNEVSTSLRNLSGYRVVAVSKDLSEKIAGKLAETYSDITRMILENEQQPEVVRVLTLNYFNLDEANNVDFSSDSDFGLKPIN